MPKTTILIGNNLNALKKLADKSVRCVVTSPPYWGLRDYGLPPVVWGGDSGCEHEWGQMLPQHHPGQVPETKWQNNPDLAKGQTAGAGQYCQKCGSWLGTLGLEPTPELYVEHLVLIFREVKRVLADDGTLWLNIGDSHCGSGAGGGGNRKGNEHGQHDAMTVTGRPKVPAGLKPKDLVGIPWMVAFALRADGWYLRSDIIWHKPNVKPESVMDRPTSCHEYVFLLSRSARYYYDGDAIKEPSMESSIKRVRQANFANQTGGPKDYRRTGVNSNRSARRSLENFAKDPEFRRKRDVWSINTKGYKGAHFATMPLDLAETCLKAGTSERGRCPTCGAPWKRVVVRQDKGYDGSKYGERAVAATGGAISGGTAKSTLGSSNGTMTAQYATVGWEPTCPCPPADPIPDIALDPFGGAGTTALVANRLGRDCILIDASEVYCVNLAAPRIRDDAPMFNQVSVVNVETEDLTPTENVL